jgi:hypothetical protein
MKLNFSYKGIDFKIVGAQKTKNGFEYLVKNITTREYKWVAVEKLQHLLS